MNRSIINASYATPPGCCNGHSKPASLSRMVSPPVRHVTLLPLNEDALSGMGWIPRAAAMDGPATNSSGTMQNELLNERTHLSMCPLAVRTVHVMLQSLRYSMTSALRFMLIF